MFRCAIRKFENRLLLTGSMQDAIRRQSDSADDIGTGGNVDMAIRPKRETEGECAIRLPVTDSTIIGHVHLLPDGLL